MGKITLTKKQNDFIYCLQNGWVIISSNESKSVVCGNLKSQFTVSATIFWNCVNKGLIYQQSQSPFHYILTQEGKEIKTKQCNYET